MKVYEERHLGLRYDIFLSGVFFFYMGILCHDFIFYYIPGGKNLSRLMQVAGLLLLFYGYLKIPKDIKDVPNGFKIALSVLLLVNVISVIRGFLFAKISHSYFVTSTNTMWFFFLPLLLFVTPTSLYVQKLKKWALVYMGVAITFNIYYFDDLYLHPSFLFGSMQGFDPYIVGRPQVGCSLLWSIGLFLYFFPKFKWNTRLLIVVSFSMVLLAVLLAGRRSAAIGTFLYCLIAFFMVLLPNRKRLIKKLFFIGIGLAIPSYVYLHSVDITEFLDKNFVILSNRLDQNTRSQVELDLYKDMKDVSEWMFGRGMGATYRSPSVAKLDKMNRMSIETGYLDIILHGGLMTLIPYVLIMFMACKDGWRKSKNIFLKSCALCIALNIVLLYPYGTPDLALNTVILFCFMRISLSKKWQHYNDNEIMELVMKKTE